MDPSEQREVRTLAVQKLKRAASLPRMKDGRRPPPMHPEAMSEGERANTDEEHSKDMTPDTPSPEPPPLENNNSNNDADNDDTITSPLPPSTPTATTTKRRSRSRTRSRGSKDLKAKSRAALSPAPSPLVPSDSSQDEAPTTLATMLMRSPTPTQPGTRPQTPNTPLPSLEDLQRGLFRSNSVGSTSASRIMAMHKLTGGQEAYDPTPPPATPPLPGKLGRNNTVSGGERTAIRELMLSRLGGRLATREPEGEPPSGEELPVPASSPSPTPRRRRRRSRRGSAGANTPAAVSDSEHTSPNTPIVPPTPLPVAELPPVLSPSRAASPRQELIFPAPTPPLIPSSARASPAPLLTSARASPAIPSARGSPAESERPRRRSVVVEEDEDEQPQLQHQPPMPLANTANIPPHLLPDFFSSPPQLPSSDYPARSSPFEVPLREKQPREDEDEEEFLYPAEYNDIQREISWIASPVPEIRMPIDDDEDDADEEDAEYEQPEPPSRNSSPHEAYDDTSPRDSFQSKGVMVEAETSPEIAPTHVPPSPSSVTALSQGLSMVRTASDDSTSPQNFSVRLSAASRTQDRSPLTAEFDLEDGKSTSTWDKIKTTFRSGSASGRRSRSNSIVTSRDRRDNTDSSVSRESGASLTGKAGEGLVSPSQSQPQSPSASASVVSLSPAVSPFPMATAADMAKYQHSKLFPFPGMQKLQEQRNRAKGMLTPSASTPDIATLYSGYETDPAQQSASSYTPSQTPDFSRERKLSHQASDTRLLDRYAASPTGSAALSSPANVEYFNITPVPPPLSPTSSSGSKLPMTLPGVKQWLSSRKKSSVSNSTTPTSEVGLGLGKVSPSASKKPSLSDLILRKDSSLGLGKDWDDVDSDLVRKGPSPEPARSPPPLSVTPRAAQDQSHDIKSHDLPLPSPPNPISPTPDLSSSLSDYPAPSTSESSSTTSSQYSLGNPQGQFVLERLDESLARGSRSPMWTSVLDEPPRKLVLSSEVLQVVNANTVKDRYLFLFTDILVIAKPIGVDQDNIIESYNPYNSGRRYTDRRYVVKNVVQLSQLRFNAERNDTPPKSTNYFVVPRNPLIRTFVHQFSRDPDHAISTLLSKSATPDDPAILGQVLFKTLDLDRARLGDYLCRRTSKVVLKAYVDGFRFVGVRVDRALRVFLLSINIPPKTVYNPNPVEYLLDSFASRWYEANARIVAFDKDLAIRLVRALVQLNDFLHGAIAQEPGPTGSPRRGITERDFAMAFRQYDPRHLVPDELLDEIFVSVRSERLSQARRVAVSTDAQIVLKRPLPPRLTYRVQSEPIILRIPQPDPYFTIQLLGQDLEFDPPVLTFARSSEASFRVTGQSLGSKTMIMCRSGPNALKYLPLPLSNSLVVERAFMRNTFEVAFLNYHGVKRRYMFSMNDPIIRHEWVGALKRHIDSANNSVASLAVSQGTSKFHRATELIAFRTLQQKLMGATQDSTGASPAAIRSALKRLNSNGSTRPTNGSSSAFRFPDPANAAKPAYHARSKSRSRLYQQGPGQNEVDLNDPEEESEPPSQHDGPVWSWDDLQLQCRQNSSIPAVLAFLQVGYSDPGRF